MKSQADEFGVAKVLPGRTLGSRACRASMVTGLVLLVGIASSNAHAKDRVAAPADQIAAPADHSTDPVAKALAAAPFATLELLQRTISIPFPSQGMAASSAGVEFVVLGNASATLTVEPDGFVNIDGRYLGKASNGVDAIGYDLRVEFPRGEARGSSVATLPGSAAEPTRPLTAVLLAGGEMEQTGVIHVVTDPNWTLDGGLPLPGNYVSHIVLTLTADY
jgi:hypothetical protein